MYLRNIDGSVIAMSPKKATKFDHIESLFDKVVFNLVRTQST